ncbi:alpha/beta family hydrolase [Denitratimonas tolerans]|mgnify:FL=1|uniref:YqiA/YcfP family alpha/beta fold hydrolase n=1 Tax=Denitratimonas tolerans TaxID=1338420 RepID=A0AAW9R879_9GAMM|nr:hypothetical protein [Xanthomonadaceae bacterium]MEB2314669.1 hypothetical protein [Xanthomonadaceae bacterium]
MAGHCILSHGLHSSPNASKVSALARVAQALGWSHERPDYSQIDAASDVRDIPRRLEKLLQSARRVSGPLVLAGSSMGAYISALASLQVRPAGLFLMAPPVALPGYPQRLDAARVPTRVIHGWHDELIAAQDVVDWCAERSVPLLLLDDNHRLEGHVDAIADEFGRFLGALA